MSQENKQQTDILYVIQRNMQRADFAKYMDFCVKKWNRLEVDLQIIDAIMSSICKQWSISKEELIANRKFTEPRAMMYYVIKKQVKLSYGEIAEMFKKQKSYIKKSVDDVTFLLEKKCEDKGKTQLSKNDKLILTAKGNPDNENVREARRILEIRGIDWLNSEEEKDMMTIFKSIQNELSEKNLMIVVSGGVKN